MAHEYGLVLLESGQLIDTVAGQRMPEHFLAGFLGKARGRRQHGCGGGQGAHRKEKFADHLITPVRSRLIRFCDAGLRHILRHRKRRPDSTSER